MIDLSLDAQTRLLDLYLEYRRRVKHNIPRSEAAVFTLPLPHKSFQEAFEDGFLAPNTQLAELGLITEENDTVTLTSHGICCAQEILQAEYVFDAAKSAKYEARISLFLSFISCIGTLAAAAAAIRSLMMS